MSDKELLSYYYQLEDRLNDIDRNTEEARIVDSSNFDYSNRDRVAHLHIGDNWGHLRQEKKLILKELYKRNISP